MTKTLLLIIAVLIAAPFVNGELVVGQGGNVSEVNISIDAQTVNWQGFSGQVFFGTSVSSPSVLNATGGLVNGSNLFFQIDCDDPISASGFVFLSNSSAIPIGLVAGNLTQLDGFISTTLSDNATQTFTQFTTFGLTQGTITNVPTVFSYVNLTEQNGSFREGYFNQGNDIVFTTVIEVNLQGYNNSVFDYQALLPAPNQNSVSYFISGDISFTCPAVEVGGGGGGGRRGITVRKKCIDKWGCSAWGNCDNIGLQHRTCSQITECPPPTPPIPPTARICRPGPRLERPTLISETDLLTYAILEKLNLLFEEARGPIFVPTRVSGAFKNNNDYSLEEMSASIIAPKLLVTSVTAHPRSKFLWGLSGWGDHGAPGVKTQTWKVKDLSVPEQINPRALILLDFEVTPPMMQPKTVDLAVDLFSGPTRVKSANVPFTVTVPPFAITGEIKENILTLYYLIDNRGKEEKDINIELSLDRIRTTLVGELIGPLSVPADAVALYGYEYKLGKAGLTADTVRARLRTPERTYKASYSLR